MVLVVAAGMMSVAVGRGLPVSAVEGRQRVEGREGHVSGKMTGQPGIEGHGEHAEPDADPIPSQLPHARPTLSLGPAGKQRKA